MTQLDLVTQRYDNILLALPTLKKHQRRNQDGTLTHMSDLEQGDRWTSLENELYQWIKELDQQEDREIKKFCESRITRIKDQIKRRGYDPEVLSGQV